MLTMPLHELTVMLTMPLHELTVMLTIPLHQLTVMLPVVITTDVCSSFFHSSLHVNDLCIDAPHMDG